MSGHLSLPESGHPAMTEVVMEAMRDEADRSRDEYERLYLAFTQLLDVWENSAERWEVMEDIISLRASFLIDRAITGLSINFDQALDLLCNHNDFTTEVERQQRDILVAAIDNLVDFAAAEECGMMDKLPEELEDAQIEEYSDMFEQYNLQWAAQENADVTFSAAMAGWWIGISAQTMLTYMTQGDERVRPWHLALEGLGYSKWEFPPELIPPIDYGCRCYLQTDYATSVLATLDAKGFADKVNPVFRESLATGGRIFSAAHPYFKKPLPAEAQAIAGQIKQKLYIA